MSGTGGASNDAREKDDSRSAEEPAEGPIDEEHVPKFSPEEEAALMDESNTIKAEANALFASQDYENALARYDAAISTCPKYLLYERAVIQSNVSACHLKLEQWTEATRSATEAIDGLAKLEREDPELNPEAKSEDTKKDIVDKDGSTANAQPDEDEVEEEIVSSGASRAAPPAASSPPNQTAVEARKADILRIRTKALLRRARARSSAGGWQNLAGAEEDYRTLSTIPGLTAADARTVRSQLRELPPRVKAAQEKEMGEMWGKLRELGDGILKPFGLSTNNFQMIKDEKTGGYSMNFNQNGKPS